MTGGAQELIASGTDGTPHCAAAQKHVCAYAKEENNELIFTSFDPELKQRQLGRFTYGDPKGVYEWALSPDANQIAIYQRNTGNIYLLNLKTQALEHIPVKRWKFVSMDWAADGKGLFLSALQPDCVLLHVDLHGKVQVLWEPRGENMIWALPSPDGRYVAMPHSLGSVNVWMMENF
jgi:hypothetical protein